MDESSIRFLSGISSQPITQPTRSAPSSTRTSNNPATSAAESGNFQQLLTTLMLASTLSNSSGGSDSSGLFGGDMFSPILFNLVEQLMAQQENNAAAATGEASLQSAESRTQGRPVAGGTLTQGFHAGHNGLDFGVPVGTAVHSTMNGNVVYAGWNDQGYGNLVIVENGSRRTYYAHLSSIPVTLGQTVQANDVIGLSGNTGNSTGPHLHYEIRENGQAIDPTALTLG